MWLPVSTIAALCVLFDIFSESFAVENDLEIVFKERTHSDWENAWHKERYTRCRETLIRHLYWACEKDIYRLRRRSDQSDGFNNYFKEIQEEEKTVEFPWLPSKRAKTMLRFRRGASRRSGSSITAECCKSTGCTWEEYAEYCPTNKRYTSYV